jgi:Helix-hairpin-helix motif
MRLVAIVIGLLTAIYVTDVIGRLRGPPALGASEAHAVAARPIERAGQGFVCVPSAAADASGLRAFDRSCQGRDGPHPCGHMSARRRLLVGGMLDLGHATVDDLEALPGIGPRLAKAIVDARPADLPALAAIRGLGRARASALAHAVGLDDRRSPDICSTGLWPTISSGYGRPR